MEPPALDDETPQTRLQKVEIGEPESASNLDASSDDDGAAGDDEASSSSEGELVPPAQQSGEEASDDGDSTNATEAGWRIRWNPVYTARRA